METELQEKALKFSAAKVDQTIVSPACNNCRLLNEPAVALTLAPQTGEYRQIVDPNFSFLDNTLVRKLHFKCLSNSVVFSCRRWRATEKKLQIDTLKSLKVFPTKSSVDSIAIEIHELVEKVYSVFDFSAVIAVPGNSSGKFNNFSTLVAHSISDLRNIPFARPLKTKHFETGQSTPKRKVNFDLHVEPGDLKGKSVIIVDDVITGGMHMQKCVSLLQQFNISCAAVTWIRS